VLDPQQILFLVMALVVLCALIVIFVALRTLSPVRAHAAPWKRRVRELEQKSARIESVLGAFPGLILVWENTPPDPLKDWGEPKTFGSSAAMASLVRFAAPGSSKEMAKRVLDGLADHNTVLRGHHAADGDALTLRRLVQGLCDKAKPFSAIITLPGGKMIEVDGDMAGANLVLWLSDTSIRGQDDETAVTHVENEKLLALSDPIAFVDLIGRAPFPIWRMDSNARLVWANTAYVNAVGAEDLPSVKDEQIFLDEQCSEQAQKVLDENLLERDTRPLVLNGARKPTMITIFPITGGLAGMAVDASDAQYYKDALTRHIRAHDETLNKMGEAVVIFGADKRMNFHNVAFAEMFGLDEQWFKDRPSHAEWLDHLRDKRVLQAHAKYNLWKQNEISYYTDWPDDVPDEHWSLPDGRELRLVRMRDPDGGLSLLFGDITDQISMKTKFDALINVQEATLDKLTEGVAVFGLDGRLKISNAAFQDMWHLSDGVLQNQPLFTDLIKEHVALYHDRSFWQDMMARTTDTSPEVRRHISGEIKRSDDTVLTYISKPLPDGATLIAWDNVTHSRQAEAALIERAEAVEASNRIKSEFVGHVSYQLRTPLTTILGYAEFLQSGAVGELTDKQSEYVFAIESASADLAKTIDDILDIAAIDADTVDLELGDVDLYYLLESALDYVATKAEDTHVSLTLNAHEDVGIMRADEKRIKQIVHNLLGNALRFTKRDGKIELGADGDEQSVRIWVKDNGAGIPAEQQPQVFESFSSQRGGAGLGLALVERFVHRHGGWVELESEEGVGTQVTCHLPRIASLEGAEPELDL
jgi:signal transduction histidine kinase